MFISPLSPEAFFHYKFKYLGLSSQGEYFIDKIEVTPKRKSQQLFEGTIYIIEDLWCLHSVDLVNDNIAGKVRVQQLYIPVQDDIWMPVSHKFDIDISIIGVKAEAGYGSSIRYKEVKINPNLQRPEGFGEYKAGKTTGITERDTAKTRTTRQIETIISKKELTNRDMVKLSGLLNKQSKESLPDSVKNNLEIKETTTYVIEKDADKKDSAWWADIRPIPLSEKELRSIQAADSLKTGLSHGTQKTDSTKKPVEKKKGFFPFLGHIAFNHTWSDTSDFSFTNSGLFNIKNLSFNTVDGLIYGMDFRINKAWNKKQRLGIYPAFLYGFSRERFMWKLNSFFNFANKSQTQIYLWAGSLTRDINGAGGGINPLINSVTTLFLESNFLKLYSGRYITLGCKTEIANGLYIDLRAGFEKRNILTNSTSFTIIETSRSYSDNVPVNSYLSLSADPSYILRDHNHGDFDLILQYTPRMKYIMKGESKQAIGSDWPTFSISWKHGINNFKGSNPSLEQYDLLRFEAFQLIPVGAMGEFRWRYRAGGFLKNTGFTFIDFNHFNAQPVAVLLRDYEDAFMLPDFYSLSSPEMFSEFHTKYTTPYLFLKLIPGLSKTLMRENLSLSFLWSRYHEAYTEIGYSVSEIFLLGELGVYAGFNNFSYNSIGLKLTLRFN